MVCRQDSSVAIDIPNQKESHMHRRRPPVKVLFIIKQRMAYGTRTKAYGLVNSCRFVATKLNEFGIQADVVEAIDNNCIDRLVTQYKPTHCFIEALWVVPSKFETLARLHPSVKWIVRLHSMVPFLTSEGMAFEWLNAYHALAESGIDIEISVNNRKMLHDMNTIYPGLVSYTPNIYTDLNETCTDPFTYPHANALHIGCFGALRVLKNHSQQAIWAMEFAESIDKTLWFHVNISEHEQREAGPILRNLRAMFANTNHHLVEHPWYGHEEFMCLVRHMDIGMQVSFTETFNVVAADFVHARVPIVVSNEIEFVVPECQAEATNKEEVLSALRAAYNGLPHCKHPKHHGCLSGAIKYIKKAANLKHWSREALLSANEQLLQDHNTDACVRWIKMLRAR